MHEQAQIDRIRLVLVDDQVLFRSSLSRYLASQPGLEVAGECGNATEALETLKGTAVDLVLLGLDQRAGRDEVIGAARGAGSKARFLILSGAPEARNLVAVLKIGAAGVFLKSEALDRLVQAIRLVASGSVWVDEKVIQLLADPLADRLHLGDPGSVSRLTDREDQVLRGIIGGLTNRKIGDNIGLSEASVKTVVQQLFVRAGVRTRSQLVRVALDGSLGAIRELVKRKADTTGEAAVTS